MTPQEIQSLREALDLSRAKFAERLGVAERTIIRWEGGEVCPSPLALNALKELQAQAEA